jgi:hypothetical protein
MGKKLKRWKLNISDGQSLLQLQTDSLNKHGELRGRNKKETKVLQATCLHHKIGKRGKVKMRVNPDEHAGIAHCTMCGEDFRVAPYTKEERKRICGDFREFLNQTKYFAVASKASEANLRQLAEVSIGVNIAEKINKKTTKIVLKQDSIVKKDKKNRLSSTLGSWNINRR